MKSRNRASVVFALFTTVATLACSELTTVAPSGAPDAGREANVLAQTVAGCYALSFLNSSLQPVTTLVVLQELVLKAHVDNCAGSAAQRGSVTFHYCSLKGGPPNDITRADEAPSAACATGQGSWARLTTVPVNASGDALMNFGFVRIPRTIGFRFKYQSQGTGIASGGSAPADFTWTAAP
jgi:hypothetical protein